MINQSSLVRLKKALIMHEGISKTLYKDSVGKWTIGVGYNIQDRGLPDEWIDKQLENDIRSVYEALEMHEWFRSLGNDRQLAIINMGFNMGVKKLLQFKKMIAALEQKNYAEAATQALDSLWAKQVGNRAKEIAEIIRIGEANW